MPLGNMMMQTSDMLIYIYIYIYIYSASAIGGWFAGKRTKEKRRAFWGHDYGMSCPRDPEMKGEHLLGP